MSTETNDRAFITVNQDLLRLRNDLKALQQLESIAGKLDAWTRDQVTVNLRSDALHSKGWEGMSAAVVMLSDRTKMRAEINKTLERITSLERLCETYMRGGDIVQAKLAGD